MMHRHYIAAASRLVLAGGSSRYVTKALGVRGAHTGGGGGGGATAPKTTKELVELDAKYLLPLYGRAGFVISHAEGSYVYTLEGVKYLDFMAGVAVSSIGHAHPEWVDAVTAQVQQGVHFSNYYHNQWAPQLAQRLIETSGGSFDRVFLCNSGCEANEAALKFSRKYGAVASGALPHPSHTPAGTPPAAVPEVVNNRKHKIVAFERSFHGRTMGALSATHKAAYRAPFSPLVPGFVFGRLNDLGGLQQLIDDDTAAVIVEPVQGEGGVTPCTGEFLRALRHECNQHQALLVFDEIQCGLARTGHLWAHEPFGVEADVLTFAKPIAGGLPMGGVLLKSRVAECLKPGDHGTTFGGGPLASRAALVTLELLSSYSFLANVRNTARYLVEQLTRATEKHRSSGLVKELRGLGLLMGLELTVPVAPVIEHAREHGKVLFINAGENVLRICPPLIIGEREVDQAVDAIAGALDSLAK